MSVEATPGKVARARKALSQVFAGIARSRAERVTVDEILARMSDKSLGACLILFAAPNLLPLPPGVSSIFAVPLIFIAAQLMIGVKGLWLPKPIRRWSLGRASYRRLAHGMVRIMKRAESLVKPRMKFLTGAVPERVLGAFALILALVLLIPIPLGHLPPAFSLLILGFGVMERDGLMSAAGVVCGVFSLGLIASISTGLLALISG
jgi:hypothetical protein